MEKCECANWARTEPPMFTKHHPKCDKYERKVIRIYTVTPGLGCAPCTERDINNVKTWIEEATLGEVIKIHINEIDENIYNEMPEYMGP